MFVSVTIVTAKDVNFIKAVFISMVPSVGDFPRGWGVGVGGGARMSAR